MYKIFNYILWQQFNKNFALKRLKLLRDLKDRSANILNVFIKIF